MRLTNVFTAFDRFVDAIGTASNLVSDAGLPRTLSISVKQGGPPMRSLARLNRAEMDTFFINNLQVGSGHRSPSSHSSMAPSYGQEPCLAILQCNVWRVSGHDCMVVTRSCLFTARYSGVHVDVCDSRHMASLRQP